MAGAIRRPPLCPEQGLKKTREEHERKNTIERKQESKEKRKDKKENKKTKER